MYEHQISPNKKPNKKPNKEKLQPLSGGEQNERPVHELFRDLCAFADAETLELNRRKNASFDADDIRSLEMKFGAMLIS